MARIVIALGGNALGSTPAEQRERVAAACPALVGLIHQGHEIIISHGNGPQVGMIQAAFDTATKANPKVAPMPLPECTAMSQGYIGYHLQRGMRRTLPCEAACPGRRRRSSRRSLSTRTTPHSTSRRSPSARFTTRPPRSR
ncbi:MAG: hypothetical protein ACLUNO_08125 [Oscillospiraceae bacterium]